MDYLRCPTCLGILDGSEQGLSCSVCAVTYPARDSVDFTTGVALDEFARRQRDIYEGRASEQGVGAYLTPAVSRGLTDACIAAARRGALTPSWLGLEYRKAVDRLAPRQGETVLDIGCSTGFMLSALGEAYGVRGVGVDFSRGAVRQALEYNPLSNDYHVADALNLPFADDSFDLAVSFGVIEHVSDPHSMVAEMARVLKEGGRMLVYTTCARSRWTWHWWQRVTSGGRYRLGVDDRAGHDPERFLLPEELASMMLHAGIDRAETVVVHTLYTLMFDESFPNTVPLLLERPALFRAAAKIIELADALPNSRGYGNEFLALGWKGG